MELLYTGLLLAVVAILILIFLYKKIGGKGL